MELPQPRPYGTEGRKQPTHDFLSLYSNHPGSQQDPKPPPGYLKTHDFLHPLERKDKTSSKEDNTVEMTIIEKATPPAPPAPTSVEHTLPGGIGTYTISHISHFSPRIVPKPEGGAVFTVAQACSAERNDDNSNCSSYSGGGFTLWDESSEKRATTGKENVGDQRSITGDQAVKLGQWKPERQSQSSSNHRANFNPLSTSQVMTQKNQSFMDMLKSAKRPKEVEVFDDEDFVIKQEGSFSSRGDLTVKVDEKHTDHKANTPRSKHSATEQRRRSKINDRFQALRDLIPHSDQKRDKASFLLEVVEYIQFLQEKVQKYEGPYQGWDSEPSKLMSLRNNLQNMERFADQGINSEASPALYIAAKLDENKAASPVMHRGLQKQGESAISLATTLKAVDKYPGHLSNVATHPLPLQPSVFAPVVGNGAAIHFPHTPALDPHNLSQTYQNQTWHGRSCKMESATPSDKDQELTIEGGTISISSAYSQGLLDTLTQALHISGVDLSQASISVQIDLGKRATSKPPVSASIGNDNDFSSLNHATTHSRVASRCNESDQVPKRLKTSKS